MKRTVVDILNKTIRIMQFLCHHGESSLWQFEDCIAHWGVRVIYYTCPLFDFGSGRRPFEQTKCQNSKRSHGHCSENSGKMKTENKGFLSRIY
jgi:hypothetical protein